MEKPQICSLHYRKCFCWRHLRHFSKQMIRPECRQVDLCGTSLSGVHRPVINGNVHAQWVNVLEADKAKDAWASHQGWELKQKPKMIADLVASVFTAAPPNAWGLEQPTSPNCNSNLSQVGIHFSFSSVNVEGFLERKKKEKLFVLHLLLLFFVCFVYFFTIYNISIEKMQ